MPVGSSDNVIYARYSIILVINLVFFLDFLIPNLNQISLTN